MKDSRQPPLLLIPSPPAPLDVHVQVPLPADNLFERLIRDPQAPHRPMRERQCAEMLRSVLVTCPSLASFVFKWFAQLTGIPVGLIDELDWSLETEQSIGAKRDDLRIEGWRTDEGAPHQTVLWTIEIKVAAPLHESGRQEWEAEIEEAAPEDDAEIVNQLVNYDQWLARQDADHKAGFVLALRDMSTAMPVGLREPWHCFTWTELALEMERALADNLLPISERPFAEHMLGFIRHRLWDTTDMTASRLELDDVALLRALAAIGPSCARKMKDLVSQFKEVFEATGVAFCRINATTTFFDRTDVAQYSLAATCTNDSSYLCINAGVYADDVRVWISCNPNSKDTKKAARKLLCDRQARLSNRNPAWIVAELDASGYTDAEITKPLISVLANEDWQIPLIEFVRGAVGDLKETGILEALVGIQSSEPQS